MYAMVKVHPDSTGYEYFDAEEMGFEAQLELFEYIKQRTNRTPVVVDHSDIMANPQGMMQKFCNAVGIDFDPSMLEFSVPLPPHANGLWNGFFTKINASTGFHPPSTKTRGPRLDGLPAEVHKEITRLEPVYAQLYGYRIQP
jgi:hypothetical protein